LKGSKNLKERNIWSIYEENHHKKCSCHSQFRHQYVRGGKGDEENKLLVSSFQNPKKFQTEVISLQTNQNHWKQKKNHRDEHDAQQQKKKSHSFKKTLIESCNEWKEKV